LATIIGVVPALLFLGLLLKEGSLFKREMDGRCGRGSGKTSSTGVSGPEEVEDSVESVLEGPIESLDKLGGIGVDGKVTVDGPASEMSESLEAEKRFRTEKRRRLIWGTDVEEEDERREVGMREARGVVWMSSSPSSSSVSGYGAKPCISADEGACI